MNSESIPGMSAAVEANKSSLDLKKVIRSHFNKVGSSLLIRVVCPGSLRIWTSSNSSSGSGLLSSTFLMSSSTIMTSEELGGRELS